MTSIFHGLSITENADTTPSLNTVSTQTIGIVATGDDADNGVFPLDTPVLFTDLETALGKAGKTGTLFKALSAINANVSAPVIVVRVADNQDADALNASVIGMVDENGNRKGLQALLSAENITGLKPKIIAAPALDTQPVTTAMIPILKTLRAFGYARAIGETVADAIKYRANFDARELMLLWPDVLAFNSATGATEIFPASAFAVALRAAIDESTGFQKTLSNVAISGITGLAKSVTFDLMSMSTDAGLLNQSGITALIRNNGFKFWGNRTTASDPNYAFETATRTGQVLIDTIANGLDWAMDQPLIPSLVTTITEEINNELRLLVSQGKLIGGKCWFDTDKNTAANLAAGKLYISYNFTPVAPLENLSITQTITDSYYADFSASSSS
ncbi:phage tail sheath subtilisin-like domain-containing protein [Zymomonas mobilis]|uniref:phage tail sheath subtilisin-like domain-containing protein n=1 Tax=Zymomonas mobilis TaxID=542 RepID=UPI0039E9FF9C